VKIKNSYIKLYPKLKQLRLKKGLTQEEFAEKAGFTYKFYQQIEAGRKKQIWVETIDRLAAAHKMETWKLLYLAAKK